MYAFFSFLTFLFAKQPGIKGVIRNSNQEPVEFANVVLVQANDSTIVKAGLTETDGTYSFENIEQGQYKLLVVQLGYDKHYTEAFDLKANPEPLVLKPVRKRYQSQRSYYHSTKTIYRAPY